MQYLLTIYSIPGNKPRYSTSWCSILSQYILFQVINPGIPLASAGIPIAKYKIDSLDKQTHGTHREITPTVPSGFDLTVH